MKSSQALVYLPVNVISAEHHKKPCAPACTELTSGPSFALGTTQLVTQFGLDMDIDLHQPLTVTGGVTQTTDKPLRFEFPPSCTRYLQQIVAEQLRAVTAIGKFVRSFKLRMHRTFVDVSGINTEMHSDALRHLETLSRVERG